MRLEAQVGGFFAVRNEFEDGGFEFLDIADFPVQIRNECFAATLEPEKKSAEAHFVKFQPERLVFLVPQRFEGSNEFFQPLYGFGINDIRDLVKFLLILCEIRRARSHAEVVFEFENLAQIGQEFA